MSASTTARLVLTHSTHLETLVPALRLLQSSPLVTSIIPARLASSGGRAHAGLTLRLGTPTPSGYKVLARRGGGVQEVFLCVQKGVTADTLRAEMRRLLPPEVALV